MTVENKCIVTRLPEVKGCYGERWILKNKNDKVNNFFDLISVWSFSMYSSEEGDFVNGYELPFGVTLDTGLPLIKYLFYKLNIEEEK